MFIALEGIDGSGKGTQSKLLNKWIKKKKYETFLTKEPTEGKIGKLLRNALKKGELNPIVEALLFAADRNEHVETIRKKLAQGKIVITERYMFSSMAYQGASGISIGWIKQINKFAIMPDLVLLLDIQPETGLKRITSKKSLRSAVKEKEYFEVKEFLGKVRAIYLDLAKEYKFTVVDASGPIEDVQATLRKKVGKMLAKREKKKPAQKGLQEF
jgi:dTMP kinase